MATTRRGARTAYGTPPHKVLTFSRCVTRAQPLGCRNPRGSRCFVRGYRTCVRGVPEQGDGARCSCGPLAADTPRSGDRRHPVRAPARGGAGSRAGRGAFRGISQELGVPHTTVAGYYEILEDCLIAERWGFPPAREQVVPLRPAVAPPTCPVGGARRQRSGGLNACGHLAGDEGVLAWSDARARVASNVRKLL